MSDSSKRIAADILIAALQRSNHAESSSLSAEQIENEAECLAKAFQVIRRAVDETESSSSGEVRHV